MGVELNKFDQEEFEMHRCNDYGGAFAGRGITATLIVVKLKQDLRITINAMCQGLKPMRLLKMNVLQLLPTKEHANYNRKVPF